VNGSAPLELVAGEEPSWFPFTDAVPLVGAVTNLEGE
jgi:hypothetical protein